MEARQLDPAIIDAVVFSIQRALARRGTTLGALPSRDLDGFSTYWTAAADVLGEDLALQVAAEIPIGALGVASYGSISAPTLGEALQTLGENLDRLIPQMSLRVVAVARDHVEVRIQGEGHPMMPLLEELMVARVYWHSSLPVTRPTFHAIGLRRTAPTSSSPWRAFFGLLPRFGQRHSMLRVAASDLQIALRTASSAVHAISRATVDPRDGAAISERVRSYLRAHVREPVDPAAVARELDVTPRTLQRRLQAEQTSLRLLATEVRIAVARELLEHTERTIVQIAGDVGFSRPTSFSRAFAAATSETPQAYRKRHRD